jgi:hypothetical protein
MAQTEAGPPAWTVGAIRHMSVLICSVRAAERHTAAIVSVERRWMKIYTPYHGHNKKLPGRNNSVCADLGQNAEPGMNA